MGLGIGDNFNYQGKKHLDDRHEFPSIEAMRTYPEYSLPDIFRAFVEFQEYEYRSDNEYDEVLGKWRKYTGGGGGVSYVLGNEEPTDKEVIWFDTSDTSEVPSFSQSLYDEIVTIMQTFRVTVVELTSKVKQLESRIEVLEAGGGGSTPDDGVTDALFLQDGSYLLLQDGTYLQLNLTGSSQEEEFTDALLLQDGNPLLLQDSTYLQLR